MRQRRTLKELDTDLHIDPMVDVVFQLLVFFLFSFHLRQMEILLQAQVVRQGAAAKAALPVAVHLEADARGQLQTLRLEQRVVSLAELPRELAELRRQRQPADCQAVLWPEDGLHYEHVVAVSQAIVEAGWDIRFGQRTVNGGGGP